MDTVTFVMLVLVGLVLAAGSAVLAAGMGLGALASVGVAGAVAAGFGVYCFLLHDIHHGRT